MIFEAEAFVLPHSISATYHVDSCIAPFMIILGSAGLLLICYEGYDKQDKIVCTLAGIFGIGICLVPCFNLPDNTKFGPADLIGTFKLPSVVSG